MDLSYAAGPKYIEYTVFIRILDILPNKHIWEEKGNTSIVHYFLRAVKS